MTTDPVSCILHVHSSYSLLEGALTIAQARRARQGGPPAGAGADRHRQHVRCAGVLREARRRTASSRSSAARSPSISAIRTATRGCRRRAGALPRIVLLAATEDGYRNLMRLSSRAFLEHAAGRAAACQARRAWRRCATGLIALTGGPVGPLDLGARGGPGRARGSALRHAARCSATGSMSSCSATAAGGAQVEPRLVDLAYAQRPAAGRHQRAAISRAREDYEAHDALICIAEGRVVAETDRRQLTPEHCFKTRAEMAALFADLPEALASTVEIARALRVPARRRASRSCRASRPSDGRRSTRRRSCARAGRGRARRAASPRTASRRAAPTRTTASGSPSSSASSSG